MRRIDVVAGGLAAAMLLSGCATMREREWGSCAIGGGIIGAAVGGITTGVALNNTGDPSNGAQAGAIVGGVLGGGAIGALLGHAICDPIPEPPAPKVAQVPPPPPPPSKTKIATLKGTNFAFNSSALTKEGEHALDAAVKTLKDNPSTTVTANGYTLSPAITIPSNATSVTIGTDGVVTVLQTSSPTPVQVGQIQLASFVNTGGLQSMGQNLYLETASSGTATPNTPGTNGVGLLNQGYVETSNVNAVEELVNLITTQRAYELNSRSIQTSDQMLARLTQL